MSENCTESIRIRKSTKDELTARKLYDHETFDEVICRHLKNGSGDE